MFKRIYFKTDKPMNMHSERPARGKPRGQASESDIGTSLHVEDSPRLAAGSFNEGFTLVELLIVVAIIAILAAIAIPQFSLYKQRAVRASMVSDAKNTSYMLESYFITNQTYVSPITSVGPGPATDSLDGAAFTFPFSASTGNTISIAGTATTYTITVSNANAGVGKSPLTWTSAGACTWADGANC